MKSFFPLLLRKSCGAGWQSRSFRSISFVRPSSRQWQKVEIMTKVCYFERLGGGERRERKKRISTSRIPPPPFANRLPFFQDLHRTNLEKWISHRIYTFASVKTVQSEERVSQFRSNLSRANLFPLQRFQFLEKKGNFDTKIKDLSMLENVKSLVPGTKKFD